VLRSVIRLANPIRAGKERRLTSVRAIFPGYHPAIPLTVAYSAIFVTTGQEQCFAHLLFIDRLVRSPRRHPAMHFHPKPGATSSKTINIELTLPNTSNLKSFGDADRRIVEAY
jgi:hypothetical protein